MASVRERQTKSGEKTWAVLYRQGKKQSSTSFDSAKAARKFADLINAVGVEEALKLIAAQQRPKGITVADLAAQWLASKEGDVTPNIWAGYKRDYENWIDPWFGHREAAMVDEMDVQRWVDDLRTAKSSATGKPLSPKSIADRHAILHQIFGWGAAKTRKLVPHNPCKETELPRRQKTQPKGLRLPELLALIEKGRAVDADAADLVAFIASTGWRISEAVALAAGSVEDDGERVYVTMEQVLRSRVGITKGGKSAAAVRRLRVLGPGVEVVRRRVVGKAPGDLVFTFKDGRPGVKREGPWNINSFRDTRWPRLVAAAGLTDRKPTPHWLRHSHVAICHAAGLSLAEIQRRLGHEDIQTTINIYGRMIDEMNDVAADRLDSLLMGRRDNVVPGEVIAKPPTELT